jgi:hypothetical protein
MDLLIAVIVLVRSKPGQIAKYYARELRQQGFPDLNKKRLNREILLIIQLSQP